MGLIGVEVLGNEAWNGTELGYQEFDAAEIENRDVADLSDDIVCDLVEAVRDGDEGWGEEDVDRVVVNDIDDDVIATYRKDDADEWTLSDE